MKKLPIFKKNSARGNRLPMSKFLVKAINGLFSVKGKRAQFDWFLRISQVVLGRRSTSMCRVNLHFVRQCQHLARTNSIPFLVKYLKACHVLLMQSAAGMKIPASQSLGVAVSRTRGGIPRIVPVLLRERIRGGDVKAIKWSLTLMSVYRILEFPGLPNLSTITAPGADWSKLMPEAARAIELFWRLRPWANWSLEKLIFKPFLIDKVSSTSDATGETQKATSVFGLVRAAHAWFSGPFDTIERWCNETGNDLLLEYIFFMTEEPITWKVASLGRLGFKQEAAGKVRVFAMVDAMTNWLLKPLHDLLFDYLRGIDQDGTFDQIAPVEKLQRKGHRSFWCYDLSSATDRLPVKLQVLLLRPYLGKIAELWASLLIDRDYTYPMGRGKVGSVKYAVGQPMGALSSWAMLALTHHFIVQWAAMRSESGNRHWGRSYSLPGKVMFSFRWFENYAVLGDDIVIADGRVAREYVLLMSELGVGIGLAKSLISHHGGLEFAKRYFVAGVDASPVPFKELFAARGSISSLVQFGARYELRIAQLLDILGYGYRVKALLSKPITALPRRVKNLVLMVMAPKPGVSSLEAWLMLHSIDRVSRKSNWLSVLWGYIAFQQNRLGDALEAKQAQWNVFAKAMGHLQDGGFFKGSDGLDLDSEKSQFDVGMPTLMKDQLSDRTKSMISMVLYFEKIQRDHRELQAIEEELTDIYKWAMDLQLKWSELPLILEDIHVHFCRIEDQLALIRIVDPATGELRPQDDDKVLLRNPLLMAKLWGRLNSLLRSPPEPSLLARLTPELGVDPSGSCTSEPMLYSSKPQQ